MRSTDAELRPCRMSRMSPVQMVRSSKLVIASRFAGNSDAYNSYSSYGQLYLAA